MPLAPLQTRPQELGLAPSARAVENPMGAGRDPAAKPAEAAEAGPTAQASPHDSTPPSSTPTTRAGRHPLRRETRRDRIVDSEKTTPHAANSHHPNDPRPDTNQRPNDGETLPN